MFPRRREEKERMYSEGEGVAEGINANGHRTGQPGQTPGLVWSKAHQSASPFPLCSALKQAIGIIVGSQALSDKLPIYIPTEANRRRKGGRTGGGREDRRGA